MPDAKVVALDLSKEGMANVRRRSDLDDAVRSAMDTFGGVDILVNPALCRSLFMRITPSRVRPGIAVSM